MSRINLLAPAVLWACAALASSATQAGTSMPLERDYGALAAPAAASKTIRITPATRWVNVDNGDTITFDDGKVRFTWHFSTFAELRHFDFAAIAPAAMTNKRVTVYLSRNPLYSE